MNQHMMRLGALLYDAWWIWLLANAVGMGTGAVVQWRFAHPAWLAWSLVIGAGVALAIVAGWLMARWHQRCQAWRELAQLQRDLHEAGRYFMDADTAEANLRAFIESLPTMADWEAGLRKTQGDDDATE